MAVQNIHSQENKEKNKFKAKTIAIVSDSTENKSQAQKNSTKNDSLLYFRQQSKLLNDSVQNILKTLDNLVEIYNYKKGFYDRNFIKRDFEDRMYDPSKEDNWRFDADIELAKIFMYLTKNQDSINNFQKVIYNNVAKKTLFDASLVLSKKPDSVTMVSSIKTIMLIDVKNVTNFVGEEKIRLESNLNKYFADACNLKNKLAQLNKMNRENTNFPILLEKLKVEFNYSSYLLSVINGIKKYKVEDSYFEDKFGVCE
jgi:hypothetical protein